MPSWQQIRKKIKGHPILIKAWEVAKHVGKASESPAGFGAVAVIGLLVVIYVNMSDSSPDPVNIIEEAPAPYIQSQAPETVAAIKAELQETTQPPQAEVYTLKRRETLIGLLKRASINNSNAHETVNALKKVTNLRKLRAGQNISLLRTTVDGGKIAELRIRNSFYEEAVVRQTRGTYEASRDSIETYPLTHFVEGDITDSLYLSAQRAGMPASVIVDLIRLMSFDVDFEREIRTGDHFEVYYERDYAPSFNDVENGKILHAKLTLRKRELDAFFFKDADGREGYFDVAGKSTKRALMKTPLDVAVMTSSYGKRKHPVLGYTRMHKGADFRAPTGTPIMAAGDGVIEMSARNGSYGNYVRIRHNGTYKTAYAHLSRYGKGVKKGRRVNQGQIIGYSGATGRVTGAHLHYEVMVNNKQVNPMTLKLPTGRTLKGTNLTAFKNQTDQLLADMENVKRVQAILRADEGFTTIKNAAAR